MQPDVETLPGGTRVYTTRAHRFGTDALLLARFCTFKRQFRVCDLGSGSGVLLLALIDAGLAGGAVGVEIDEEGAALLRQAAAAGQLANVQAVCGDFRAYTAPRPFDMVVANPPYFSAGPQPPAARRAVARHEVNGTLEELCATAARLLKDGGRFCVCYPAARLAALFCAMQAQNLAPKRLQLARKSTTVPPWLALVDARKAGGEGLAILPDIVLPPGSAVHY